MLLAQYADRQDTQGRQAIVRNGYLPEREVQTGLGAVRVKVPRVRDRSGAGIRFHSALLPPLSAAPKVWRPCCPGSISKASPQAISLRPCRRCWDLMPRLSATLSRLKQGGQEETDPVATSRPGRQTVRLFLGRRRVLCDPTGGSAALPARHYWWDASGHKELVGLWDGYRESEQS